MSPVYLIAALYVSITTTVFSVAVMSEPSIPPGLIVFIYFLQAVVVLIVIRYFHLRQEWTRVEYAPGEKACVHWRDNELYVVRGSEMFKIYLFDLPKRDVSKKPAR